MLNVIKNNISELITNIPSYIFLFLIASTAIIVGIEWDISWHETIGRDKLLSPPHIVVYVGGILCGLTCAYIALRQTFVDENVKGSVQEVVYLNLMNKLCDIYNYVKK